MKKYIIILVLNYMFLEAGEFHSRALWTTVLELLAKL